MYGDENVEQYSTWYNWRPWWEVLVKYGREHWVLEDSQNICSYSPTSLFTKGLTGRKGTEKNRPKNIKLLIEIQINIPRSSHILRSMS